MNIYFKQILNRGIQILLILYQMVTSLLSVNKSNLSLTGYLSYHIKKWNEYKITNATFIIL